jgi:hypothetical protein
MKKVKMLKTINNRFKGFIYPVTDRYASILIKDKLAIEVLPKEGKEVKEDKEAKGRKTK